MKALFKLLVAALLINAAYQAGHSYYEYYNFKQDVHMEMLNGGFERSDDMQRHILEMAAARGHVMTSDDVHISLDHEFIVIDMKWVDNIAFVPRFYSRPWPYESRVQVKRVKPMKIIP
jgi:hypothetical protein